MAENFPNLARDLDIQAHEANWSPHYFNLKQLSPRHIIIKAAREKKIVTYKGNPIRLSADFLADTLQARREWSNSQEYSIWQSYPREMEDFPRKTRAEKFTITRCAL